VEALQVAGDSIDAVGTGANVGASSNAGLLGATGVATTTTTTFVIITG